MGAYFHAHAVTYQCFPAVVCVSFRRTRYSLASGKDTQSRPHQYQTTLADKAEQHDAFFKIKKAPRWVEDG